jgi:hypothetical protein
MPSGCMGCWWLGSHTTAPTASKPYLTTLIENVYELRSRV